MLLNFIFLVSVLVYSKARRIPQLEVYEIREDGIRKDLDLRHIYGNNNERQSELSRILSAARLKKADSYFENGNVGIVLLGGPGQSISLENGNSENDDYTDKTRSVQGNYRPDSVQDIWYQYIPKRKEPKRPKILRSPMVDDRTAAPRHRYQYDK